MLSLIEIVSSDLNYLYKEWNETVDDDSLRRSSSVLRRLLVNNDLQRAWLDLGMKREPVVKASSLNMIIKTTPLEKIVFASAGGAKYKGAELRGILMVNYAMSPNEIKESFSSGISEETLGLRAFINAPAVIVGGQIISRSTIIKYIANKLGGNHFDQTRSKDNEGTHFTLLDKAADQIRLLDKNAIYFEMLSAGQALVSSEDIKKFIEKSKTMAEKLNV